MNEQDAIFILGRIKSQLHNEFDEMNIFLSDRKSSIMAFIDEKIHFLNEEIKLTDQHMDEEWKRIERREEERLTQIKEEK